MSGRLRATVEGEDREELELNAYNLAEIYFGRLSFDFGFTSCAELEDAESTSFVDNPGPRFRADFEAWRVN